MPSTIASENAVINKSLFAISWPIFIDIFLHFSTLLINTYMVSKISSSWVGSMAIGNHIFDLCITVFSFVSVGCSVVIAQYLGLRDEKNARKAIHISIGFNALIGVFAASIIFLFGDTTLILMNMPEHLRPEGSKYLHILGFCLIPEAISLILAAVLRVYGKAKAAMYVTLIINFTTILINIFILYGLAGVPKFGLVGVAWSTVFGRTLGIILLAYLLISGLKIRLCINEFFNWSGEILYKILKVGLPAAGENLVWILQYSVAVSMIGSMGETALATQTIYFQIALFIMLFGISVSIGNEILVGHLVGAKRIDDAYKQGLNSLKLAISVTLLVVIIFYLCADKIMSAFTSDQKIIDMALPLFALCLILEPFRSVNIVFVNALRAAGDARYPLMTALIFMCGVGLPVAWFFGVHLKMGLLGIWLGFFCDESIRALANGYRWKSKKWQTKRLV